MIQRIQSVWLFLAALISAGLFYFGVYKADTVLNGVTVTEHLKATNHYPLLLIALVTIILPLVAIFMFKNRKRQISMAVIAIISNISFLAVAIMKVGNINNQVPVPVDGTYLPGAVLPVVSMVFLMLAISGIRKDEKLVKSVDRLR